MCVCVFVCARACVYCPKTRELSNRFNSNFTHALLTVPASPARKIFNCLNNAIPEQSLDFYMSKVKQ